MSYERGFDHSMQMTAQPDGITVRPAKVEDIPQLIILETKAFSQKHFPLFTKRHFMYSLRRPTCELRVAVNKLNIIMGYVLIYFRANSKAARLYSIAVNPDYHGQGLGKFLLTEVEKIARNNNCEKILLEVRADSQKVIALYIKNGYKQIKLLPEYYPDGGAGIKMVKALNN